ncbi:MAG: hypothetical protein WC023_06280 [Rhodocyclaceae bacterium]
MTDLKQLAALTALNNMMAGSHFSICTVRDVGAMLGVAPDRCEAYRMLTTLHCIHWDKMPPELLQAIPGLIQECLGIAPVYQFKTAKAEVIDITPPTKRGGFLKLIGIGS